MPEALVGDFMTEAVVTVRYDTPLARAAARMSEARVSCVVACAADGSPLGVVSERGVTRAYARDAGRETSPPVASAMSRGCGRWAPVNAARRR